MKEADFMMAYSRHSTKNRTFTHLNAYQRGQIQILVASKVLRVRLLVRSAVPTRRYWMNYVRGQLPRLVPIIDASRLIFRRLGRLSMNAIAVIVGTGTKNWPSISNYFRTFIRQMIRAIDHFPRKILNYRTPAEASKRELQRLASWAVFCSCRLGWQGQT